MAKHSWFQNITERIWGAMTAPPGHYQALRRNVIIALILISLVPLGFMTFFSHYQSRTHAREGTRGALLWLNGKVRDSIELYLNERMSVLKFITSSHSADELSDQTILSRIYNTLTKEPGGFSELSVLEKNSFITWSSPGAEFQPGQAFPEAGLYDEAIRKGHVIRFVCTGPEKKTRMVMAVSFKGNADRFNVLAAVLDSQTIENLISPMKKGNIMDMFLVDDRGILRSESRHYGQIPGSCILTLPPLHSDSMIHEFTEKNHRNLAVMTRLLSTGDILVSVQPEKDAGHAWHGYKNVALLGFAASLILIPILLIQITGVMIRRIRISEDQRESILTELRRNQKLSSIGRLAAGVAHEINNPLAIINENAGLMNDLMEISGDFTYREKFAELTDSVIRSVDRCRNVTHRLLGYARQIDVKVEPMDVNAVIRDVAGFIGSEAALRKIDVQLNLDEYLHRIASDKGQIQQVLLNLLTNACSAVDDGGVITVTSENNGKDQVKIRVADNGCGIPESDLDHVFDPYFSTNNTNGIGLGLAIAHAVIIKLGGTITVKSREGDGAVFTMILPTNHKGNP